MTGNKFQTAAVLGAGTMGPGIAFSYAKAGCSVRLYTRSAKTLASAANAIKKMAEVFEENGRLSDEEASSVLGRIIYTNDIRSAVQDAELVTETIIEDPEAKRELYNTIEPFLGKETVLASNTSYMDIFRLVPEERQSKTVITHFFAPPHIIPLTEVVRGPHTGEEIMTAVFEFLKEAGKYPIRVESYTDGFIVNKIQKAIGFAMTELVDGGFASPETVDKAVKTSIIPRAVLLGLFQARDFNGLDVASDINDPGLSPSLKEHLLKGEYGIKTGKGWYDYSGQDADEIIKNRDKLLLEILNFTNQYVDRKL